MARIGSTIESGAVHTVLVDSVDDAVVATNVTSVDGDLKSSLPLAVETMRVLAAGRNIEVDGVGLAYRSDAERELFEAAFQSSELETVSMFSASAAFLAWLAQSPEFASAERVLLYYMGDAGVTISLADAVMASLTAPKTAVLDEVTPERIGSTVPLAWEVLDEAGVRPDVVALFGDGSGSTDLVDILALGLGVPVVRVGDPDQVAAWGAALLAAEQVVDAPALVPVPEPEIEEPIAAEASTTPMTPEPIEKQASVLADRVPQLPRRRAFPHKKVVLVGALLLGVLSGGVALASTLPADAPATESSVGSADLSVTGADTSLVGANRLVEIVQPPPTPEVAAPPSPEVAAPPVEPVPPPPSVAPASVTEWPVQQWTVDPTTRAGLPREAPVPIPAGMIPPAAAVVPSTTVAPPAFAVPAVVPEPGKSQDQLEQEAWDRHWQKTAQWLEQEIIGN